MGQVRDPFRRVRIGLGALTLVLVVGTVGYLLFGFSLLDALYQTVITVTTVGFNSPRSVGAGSKVFTIILILVGVGTALYTFSAVLEVLIEGHMRDLVRRRKMERHRPDGPARDRLRMGEGRARGGPVLDERRAGCGRHRP